MPSQKSAAVGAVGLAIRRLREESGHSQEAFAATAGLDRSYYGAIERGEFNVTIDTLVKIASALDVAASELLQRAGL
ncbi:MAG: transcriptional regulator [Solirubrobacterales bacterium]|jgi:transcriptional regulator with XRE-family HTH domain|nr:transcriptional regulator [Solirubrobacterales bacterium]